MWYVIQVINGREDVMRERIEHVVPSGVMQELFYPQYQTEIKVHGEWVFKIPSFVAISFHRLAKRFTPNYWRCSGTFPLFTA